MSDPSLMSKYIPQYKPGIQYDFSTQGGFLGGAPTQKIDSRITESDAKSALRTLVDFMKSETVKNRDLAYEPLLSQLISLKL
jgi:hypothetical protein